MSNSLQWVLVPVAQFVMASWGWHHAHVLAARSRTLQRESRAAMLLLLKKCAISPKLGHVSKHRGYDLGLMLNPMAASNARYL